MAETLGSICDKLTIIKLKQFHSSDRVRLNSLHDQEKRLKTEIDQFVFNAFNNYIPLDQLSFKANKVFKQQGNEIIKVKGDFGSLFCQLAEINCNLWHAQEKVYDFENVLAKDKNKVVKQLAILNLNRNQCIDEIDRTFVGLIVKKLKTENKKSKI